MAATIEERMRDVPRRAREMAQMAARIADLRAAIATFEATDAEGDLTARALWCGSRPDAASLLASPPAFDPARAEHRREQAVRP